MVKTDGRDGGDRRAAIEALLHAVRQLYGAMDRFDSRTGAALGIDRTAVRAVNLMEHGAVSPGEIGERLGLTSGSVTALLDRLEGAGLIERRASPSDGRRRDAALTAAAHRRASRHYAALGVAIARAFEDRSPEELAAASAALAALAVAFEQAGPR